MIAGRGKWTKRGGGRQFIKGTHSSQAALAEERIACFGCLRGPTNLCIFHSTNLVLVPM